MSKEIIGLFIKEDKYQVKIDYSSFAGHTKIYAESDGYSRSKHSAITDILGNIDEMIEKLTEYKKKVQEL